MDATLEVEKGNCGTDVVTLGLTSCTLGKGSEADISFESPYVSRRHVRIEPVGGRYQVRDLGSKNGTNVNDHTVGADSVWLNNGDRIELAGGEVVMRFHSSDSTLTLALNRLGVVVDHGSREVFVNGEMISPPLSRIQFDVLSLFHRRKGEACSKEEIAAAGWPERDQGDVSDQEIEQSIRRLRVRVEADPSQPQYIITVPRYGYRLVGP